MKDFLIKIDNILLREPDPAFARRARIIFENFNLAGNEKVLEVGCGRGFYLKTLKSLWPNLEVTGVDLNQKYLKKAKEFIGKLKVNLKVGDATKLPFADNTFDRIVATEIFEHIPDDQKAISEIYRVLKPGGVAIVTVPNKDYPFFWDPLNFLLEKLFKTHISKNIWWLAGIWADHERLYSAEELERKLTKIGFKIEKQWYATHFCFPFSHFILYGIGKNLVENGWLKNFNRFSGRSPSFLNKIFLWPINIIDSFNKENIFSGSTVNLILKITK